MGVSVSTAFGIREAICDRSPSMVSDIVQECSSSHIIAANARLARTHRFRAHSLTRLDMSNEKIPDIRDGLTREERIVLYVLHETQKERGDRNVPTPMLWGRVCEHFYISPEELTEMLARLGACR
jgi:hypothetical protein